MAKNLTQPKTASVEAFLAAIPDEARRAECTALTALMQRASQLPPVMWGASIVGFGRHRYPLAGGKTGEICAAGFASRASGLVLYGVTGTEGAEALLAKLGKHTLGKGCLYLKRLADADASVLEALVARAVRAKYEAD